MPRKTKEQNEEKNVKKQLKTEKDVSTKAKTTAKSSAKKASTSKVAKKEVSEKSKDTKTTKSSTKKATSQKTTNSKSTTKENSTSKTPTKKAAVSKGATKKSATKPRTTTRKSKKVVLPTNVEYYDLPYKYNQTVVKILYQNPTTMFVYWEISDEDIASYKKQYGDNFFEVTRPVLIVYNDTMHYHFEIGINDFANSWYFNINDSNCDYRVELIRKPISYNENIQKDYVYISSSNTVETPNDKILFSTNEPYTVYFRNTKNGKQRKINLPKLLEQLNLSNKDFGFPIVRNVYDLYRLIYHVDNVGEFSIDLTNPSSGNPSSHSLSSRFK